MSDSDEAPQSPTESPKGDAPPPGAAPASRLWRIAKFVVLLLLLAWLSLVFWNSGKPLPPGTHVVSQTSRLSEADVDFLESPQRTDVAARESAAIDHAEQLIVLDQSPVGDETVRHLLARKRLRPNLRIVVVTDPARATLDTAFRQALESLERAGVIVARVDLDQLRDSNPLYTGAWRLVFGWWSHPFDETAEGFSGAAAWRTRNFKADQRQLLIADDGSGGWTAIVAAVGAESGLVLRGALAGAMLASELQVAAWSTNDDRLSSAPRMGGRGVGSIDARFLTEGAIESALLDALAAAGNGDEISVAVNTLSDRPFILAALKAAARGSRLRVLLAQNPIPNQAVAGELRREGGGHIEIRWDAHEPGPSRPSLLIVQHRSDLWLNLSSASFTRRDLEDLNLEAGVELRMPARTAPARAATEYFNRIWTQATAEPDAAEESQATYWQYRFEESTGLSSF